MTYTVPSYLNFDLRIEKHYPFFYASLLSSPAGEAISKLPVDIATKDSLHFSWDCLANTAQSLESLRKLGTMFFSSIFVGEMLACLRLSLDYARQNGLGLRLRLRFDDSAFELSRIPWEYLYDPQFGRFFGLSSETSIVRYAELPFSSKPLQVSLPLNVLVATSSPRNLQQLDIEAEWSRLKKAVCATEARGLVSITLLENVSKKALRRALRQGVFHIFHFIGHGAIGEHSNQGGLIFEDSVGLAEIVSGDVLSTILSDHPSLSLIVLNSCSSTRTTGVSMFSGVAQSLVRQGVPAVVAMQGDISDRAAQVFSEEFYHAIAEGCPVDVAMTEARRSIYEDSRIACEFGIPTLFLRFPEGNVFDVLSTHPSMRRTSEGKGGSIAPVTINDPPGVVPVYFQNRDIETKLIEEFLQEDSVRMIMIIGRGGVGKTAMVCKLLKAREMSRVSKHTDGSEIRAIVYLGERALRRIKLSNIFEDLAKLLPHDITDQLEHLYRNQQIPVNEKIRNLVSHFREGSVVVVLAVCRRESACQLT